MIKTFYFLFISVLLVTACKEQVNNEITITGHLNGTDKKEITLTSDKLSYKAPVDSNGTFTIKFVSKQARTYQLKLNENLNLFLIPGDSLTINKDSTGYEFSGGQSAELSNYYRDWDKYMKKIGEGFDQQAYYSSEPGEFVKTVYTYLDTIKVPLNELSKKVKDIHPEFVRLENENLKYWMIWDLNDYETNHKSYTGQEPVLSESFYNYLKDVDLNDTTLLQLENYKGFLASYVHMMFRKENKTITNKSIDKYTETTALLNILSRKITNQHVLDEVIYKIMDEQTTLLKVDDNNLAAFRNLCKNSEYIENIENRYNKLQFLAPGNPAPEFVLYDANNKEYSLSDFKGKYLFIDVWGAFCSPCKKEAPFLNQIEQDYKGKNIEFIGICFENNTETWQKRIKEFKLKGLQLRAKNGWGSKFRDDYKIPWVPTFILIDKEGKFIDARAPKPSENLREVLDNKCI